MNLRDWLSCRKCKLGAWAKFHVLGRGSLPCDVLLIGEAPGRSEDVLGEAFIGRAGKLLDAALPKGPKFYFANILACRPSDKEGGPNRTPEPEEIEACWPRLEETIRQAKTKVVVLLGRTADEVVRQKSPSIWANAIKIPHPAYILRLGGVKSEQFKSYRRRLQTEIEETQQWARLST